jgi:hypothetical protein
MIARRGHHPRVRRVSSASHLCPMNWLAERLIVSSGFVFLLAAGASAQAVVQPDPLRPPDPVGQQPDSGGQPNPVQPPEPAGQPGQGVGADPRAVGQGTTQPWSLRLGVNELSETNVQSVEPRTTHDLGSQLDAGLGYSWAVPRGGVRFNGTGSELFYRQSGNLNQFLYGAGVGASYASTPRLSWNASDSLTSSYAQDLTLSEAGLLPPKLLTHVNTASGGLSYDLSQLTRLRLLVSRQDISTQSTPSVDSSTAQALPGASTLSASANFSRQLSGSQSLGLAGNYQRAITNGAAADIQGYLGTWQGAFGRTVTATASAGVQPYRLPGQAAFNIALALSGGFSARVRQKDTFGLHFDRAVLPGFGDGTSLNQTLTASYALSLLGGLGLSGAGSYGRGTYPQDPGHRLIGETGTLGVGYALARTVALSLGGSVYRRIDTPNPAAVLYRISMALTYGLMW